MQVSLKVTAQIEHLNITVMLEFFFKFDIFFFRPITENSGQIKQPCSGLQIAQH